MIKIKNRIISNDSKPLIIPEIGINHGGKIETAFKIIDAAKKAGAEIIKHQTHTIDDEMSNEAKKIKPGNSRDNIFSIIKKNSLMEEEEYKLFKYVEKNKMIFLSTPFSRNAVDRLIKFGVSAFKIGSGEMSNFPLLDYVSKFKKPLIVSTGLHNIKQVKKTFSFLKKKNTKFALLHTTNIYPTANNLVRLGAMTELQLSFPEALFGLSDHTLTNHACFGAVAMGASILERHYTDSMKREGPDIINSMDPKAAKELVEGSKILKMERGGSKGPIEEEKPVIDFAYASVVTIKDIKQGEIFSKENLWVKRPGSGPLFASDFKNILGKKASKNIIQDSHLKHTDIL